MDFLDVLSYIVEWVNSTIYDFFTEAIAYFISAIFQWWLETKLWSIQFAWGIAKAILVNLGVGAQLQAIWGALPSEVASSCRFFHVPEACNMLLTAAVTRWVLSWMPFF